MSEIKLDPLCFKTFPMAVTNTGHLIPCCYCDDKLTLNDPEFKKLLEVSNINNYNTLDEIVVTKPWKRFYKNLLRHKGPPACMYTCRVRSDKNDIVRKDTWIDPDTGKVQKVRNV